MLKLGLLLILLAGSSLAWWDASFPYRTQVNISNSGSNLTDYQVQVNITNLAYNNTGLVGSWHFSEGSGTKAADSSGLGNDGTLTNFDWNANSNWTQGKFGGGLKFDGVNDHISAGNGSSLNFERTSSFTIEGWAKTANTADNDFTLYEKGNFQGPAQSYGLAIRNSQGWIDAWLQGSSNLNRVYWRKAAGVTITNWNHYAMTYDGSSSASGVKVYVNGIDLGAPSYSENTLTTSIQNTNNATIGTGFTGYANGLIDEVRIYSRALSAQEIQARYNASKLNPDYSDLRFANPADASLPYWLESDMTAWVKVPSLPAGPSMMYAYYGNASATSASNYFTTFDVLGDGSSGALAVSSANTIVNSYAYLTGNETAGDSTIAVNNGTGFSNGDEILVIQMQNYSSGTAGAYEFKKISSGGGTTSLTLNAPLKNSYASGTFNSATATATQVVRVPQHTDVTINPGASITAQAWDGYTGGIVIFRASGAVSIAGSINVIGKGFRDGIKDGTDNDGYPGESYAGKPTARSTLYNLGGGGGVNKQSGYGGDGAGGGGYGTVGQDGGSAPNLNPPGNPGQGGITYGTADLSMIFLGSGGGAAYGQDSEGNGSGIIMIYANLLDNSGGITANGANALLTASEGGGGGGSGGSIYLVANAINTNSNVNANGGNGDKTGYDGYDGAGGNGGAGRIRMTAASITGTSTPSAYTTGFDTEHNRKYALAEPTASFGTEQLPDTTPPSVLIQSPASTTYNTSILTVNFTATDDNAVSCTVRLNGTVSSSTCDNYTLTLSNGNYTLNVTAADASGNTNSAQALFEVAAAVSAQAQSSSSPQISTIAGIADGNVSFSFTPAALRIRAGMQEYPAKTMAISAGVNKVQIATRVTTGGQNAPDGTKVTYTIDSE